MYYSLLNFKLKQEGKYALAIKKYGKITEFLENETYDLEEEKESSKKLRLAANLNIAACCLKTKDFRKAIEACNKALEFDANNEKGLFRLAQAYFGISEFEEAIKYFKTVTEVNPANKDAFNQLTLSQQKLKESRENEKKLYAKMFASK